MNLNLNARIANNNYILSGLDACNVNLASLCCCLHAGNKILSYPLHESVSPCVAENSPWHINIHCSIHLGEMNALYSRAHHGIPTFWVLISFLWLYQALQLIWGISGQNITKDTSAPPSLQSLLHWSSKLFTAEFWVWQTSKFFILQTFKHLQSRASATNGYLATSRVCI